jgi:hypothetical protein
VTVFNAVLFSLQALSNVSSPRSKQKISLFGMVFLGLIKE